MNNNPYNNPLKFDSNNRVTKRPKAFRFRYPRAFVSLVSAGCLMVFFSKPIYDIFLNDETYDIEQLKREHKPRFGR